MRKRQKCFDSAVNKKYIYLGFLKIVLISKYEIEGGGGGIDWKKGNRSRFVKQEKASSLRFYFAIHNLKSQ